MADDETNSRLLTQRQYARRCGVDSRTVRGWHRKGVLEIGRDYVRLPSGVRRYHDPDFSHQANGTEKSGSARNQ